MEVNDFICFLTEMKNSTLSLLLAIKDLKEEICDKPVYMTAGNVVGQNFLYFGLRCVLDLQIKKKQIY